MITNQSNVTVIPADACIECLAFERGWTDWSTRCETMCFYHYSVWSYDGFYIEMEV